MRFIKDYNLYYSIMGLVCK